ncbi:MAG: response regulator [Caulobacteraceae bacterium]|nr:response regulator [Caulobacteraceae bacterium]
MADSFFGRSDELRRVFAAIEDAGSEAIIIRGAAGAGKTALARAALAEARARGAVTGFGKYGEGETQSPYGPIMAALSDAAEQALEDLYDPEAAEASIAQALGPHLALLQRLGLRLAASAPGAPEALGLAEGEAAARVTAASIALARRLATFGQPIVLLIDDWRRAPAGGHAVLKALIEERIPLQATLLLTERDEASPGDGSAEEAMTRIVLGPLDAAATRSVLASVLPDPTAADAVAEWMGERLPAFPLDLLTLGRALTDAGALVRDDQGWRVDPVRAATLDRIDLAHGLARAFAEAPADVRRLALAAALWGDSARADNLRSALQMSSSAFTEALPHTSPLGLTQRSPGELTWAHDRVREAILEAAGTQASRLAGEMSETLRDLPEAAWPAVSTVALHFRRMGGLGQAMPERWRDAFAAGAAAARARMDSESAIAFAEAAWSLRSRQVGPSEETDRLIVREGVRAAADVGRVEITAERARILIESAQDETALAEAYEIAISAVRRTDDPGSAWGLAREGLTRFGLHLPHAANGARLAIAALRWRFDSRGRRRRPAPGGAAPVDGLTRLANAAATVAFEQSPAMATLIALEGSRQTQGDSRAEAFWLSTDTYLSAMLGRRRDAAAYGRAALAALETPGGDRFAASASLYRALYWGVIWERPIDGLRDSCLDVRDRAFAEGDLATVGVALRNWLQLGWRTCASLGEFETEARQAQAELRRLNDASFLPLGDAVLSCIAALVRGQPAHVGDDAPPAALLVALETASALGEWRRVIALGDRLLPIRRGLDSHPGGVVLRFHESLARLRLRAPMRRGDLAFIREAATLNPTDHLAKLQLIEAEMRRARGRREDLLDAYARAFAASDASSSRLDAGVAAMCASHAAADLGQPELARRYREHAQRIWRSWGAPALLDRAPSETEEETAVRLARAEAQASAAERSARARSRLLADVGHELRTPMQSLQTLLDLAADDPKTADFVTMRSVFSTLKTVVDDLTDYGALSSGEAPAAARPTRIVELLNTEIALASAQAADLGAVLSLEASPTAPDHVLIDEHRVRQVVRNLLSNAIKYGGGKVVVSLIADAAADGLTITVDDQGPGLTPRQLARIFEPFGRGDFAGDGRGLGLGLALSRRLASSLGGSLDAMNRPEGGARFVFRFRAAAATGPASPRAQSRSLRILLAEDGPLVRRLIAAMLARQGHFVTVAPDGDAALTALATGEFDLAIFDMVMPGHSGLELLERVPRQTPAVLLTASSDPSIVQRAHAAGVADVLRKPVSASELSALLARLFPLEKSGGPSQESLAHELAALAVEARTELVRAVPALLSALRDGKANAAEAHRIAGLAAQFGWPQIAQAADAVERHLRSGTSALEAVQELESAFASAREGTHGSALVSPT